MKYDINASFNFWDVKDNILWFPDKIFFMAFPYGNAIFISWSNVTLVSSTGYHTGKIFSTKAVNIQLHNADSVVSKVTTNQITYL